MGSRRIEKITSAKASDWLPARRDDAHKGEFGHVLIVAGSRGMSGAGVLAAEACLRSGAGLTTLAAPRSQQPIVASQLREAQTLSLAESPEGAIAVEAAGDVLKAYQARNYSVLAIGPGLTAQKGAARALVSILGTIRVPAVIDADGLNIISQLPRSSVKELFSKRGAPVILTPHPGEAARLGAKCGADQASRIEAAERLAEDFGAVVLLKGHETVIADGDNVLINTTGNPGLAKGGSGDVLTGMIAGLWAQMNGRDAGNAGEHALPAAALGAYLHGLAADIAVREKSIESLLASDVIEALPLAFRKLR